MEWVELELEGTWSTRTKLFMGWDQQVYTDWRRDGGTFAHSEVWSPGRKQPWLKDILQSLLGVRLAGHVPGCSLAISTDAVAEFDLHLSCPL